MFKYKQNYEMQDLIEIVSLLRDQENGCPWDIAQTHKSIRKNFIEETYEAVEAIDTADAKLLCEELGDVLLQVALHAQMEKEQGAFDINDVCDGICKKLILRHPHVFADTKAFTPEQVLHNWDKIKKQEKGHKTGADAVRAVPASLPALMRAQKVQQRAGKAGMDFAGLAEALDAVQAELEELKQAIAAGG